MKKITALSFPFVVIALLAIFSPSCEKDDFAAIDETIGINPLNWIGNSTANTSSEVIILSEGFVGDRPPASYRIQGIIKNPSISHPYTNIQIGELNVLPLTQDQVNGDPTGVLHKVLSPRQSETEWSSFQESLGQEVTLTVNDGEGIFTQKTVNIAPPLRATIAQDGVSLYELSAIDKTKPLNITWPVNNDIETRSNLYTDKVGAVILYSPKETNRTNDDGDFPSETMTREFLIPFDIGAITFTVEDLALFPSNGMVTIYVGYVRYEIDANGDPVTAPLGGLTVVSGGVSGTPYIRINEP
jgi:hypothetical protein